MADNTRRGIEGRDDIAVGDLITGGRSTTQASIVGVVERVAPAPPGERGKRYTVRIADLLATGEPERAELGADALRVAGAGEDIQCVMCTETHRGPGRLIDCLTAHIRAGRERVAAGHA